MNAFMWKSVCRIYHTGEMRIILEAVLNNSIDFKYQSRAIHRNQLISWVWNRRIEDKPMENIIIIGGGPAGISAALYAAETRWSSSTEPEASGRPKKSKIIMAAELCPDRSSTTGALARPRHWESGFSRPR